MILTEKMELQLSGHPMTWMRWQDLQLRLHVLTELYRFMAYLKNFFTMMIC